MQPEQRVYEMVEEVLERQAKVVAERAGCSLQEALQVVLRTDAGRQLKELRDGPHAQEKALDWQANLLWERAIERLEDRVTLDAAALRFAPYHNHYSWLEGYLERLEGKEERIEYYAILEEPANLRG